MNVFCVFVYVCNVGGREATKVYSALNGFIQLCSERFPLEDIHTLN